MYRLQKVMFISGVGSIFKFIKLSLVATVKKYIQIIKNKSERIL